MIYQRILRQKEEHGAGILQGKTTRNFSLEVVPKVAQAAKEKNSTAKYAYKRNFSQIPVESKRKSYGEERGWPIIQKAKPKYDLNGVDLDSKQLAWVKNNADAPPSDGKGENVGKVTNVYHKTHVGGKGRSVWWTMENGVMKIMASGQHSGKGNDQYSFDSYASDMPKKFNRKK